MPRFQSQGHAEDMVRRHRFLYYVAACPQLSDAEYDALECAVRAQWSVCVCGIGGEIGSSNPWDYPDYIREGRRPNEGERRARDMDISARWMMHL